MSSGSFELFRIHGDLPSTAGDHLSTLLRHVVAGAFTRPTAQIHLSYVHMAERQEAIFLIATTSDVAPALAMLIAEMAITALAKACRECGVPIRQMGYPTHRPRSPRGLASYHASRAVARFLASATWPTQIRFMTPTAQLAVTVELGRPFGSAATKESVVCSENHHHAADTTRHATAHPLGTQSDATAAFSRNRPLARKTRLSHRVGSNPGACPKTNRRPASLSKQPALRMRRTWIAK